MSVSIALSRVGMRNQPHYRVVVKDSRKPRDGKFIEIIGSYDPKKKDGKLTIKKERLDYWVKNGAKLSQTMSELV